jgi:L-histidine N-alpha-methyltransferase
MTGRTSSRSPASRGFEGGTTRDAAAPSTLSEMVRFYLQLTPRQLPSRLLYDTLGSALFEAICHLPWYGITRAELRLLERHAADILAGLGPRGHVVELGCGNGEKLATLLRGAAAADLHAHLIDLSGAALARAGQALAADATRRITRVTTHCAAYEDGLLALPAADGRPTLVVFLGSNIGNFDAPGAAAFLTAIRRALRPGDALLLGADLVKPERELLLAYDDPLGLTAAFDKNLLLRLNTELQADFDLSLFRHEARWNRQAARVEMHLVSLATQDIHLPAADLRVSVEAGESIWTESSYKYEPDGIRASIEAAGFVQRGQWVDGDARFALTLCRAA